MLLSGQQFGRTLAHPLGTLTALKPTMVQKELQQRQVVRAQRATQKEVAAQTTVEVLGNTAGTVVVMDPKSGRVYTVVNQDWGLRRGLKPCSTIKLVTGVAGISEKVIQPTESISDSEKYRMNLTDALAHSNNTFFQQVGGQVRV